MELDSNLKRLLEKLPSQQQTFDFAGDNTWGELSRVQQRTCCEAISDLMQHIVLDQNKDKHSQEGKEDE